MKDSPLFFEDLKLTQRAQHGDNDAMERLGERLRCVPVFVARRNAMLGRPLNVNDLDDLVQDVVAAVLKKIDRFNGEAPFEGWVYKFSVLEMKSFMSRKIHRESRSKHMDKGVDEIMVNPGANPDRYEDIHSGLNEIDSEQSQIIRLKHFSQLTFDEISRRLHVSSNTVKTRYYRGLIKLRAYLDPRRMEEGA